MYLKVAFLGNPDRRIGTRAFLPFLALIGRLVRFLESIQFALLTGDRCRCVQLLPTKSEASACPLASCPSHSYCTGPAMEVDTYAAHEPLAQPL